MKGLAKKLLGDPEQLVCIELACRQRSGWFWLNDRVVKLSPTGLDGKREAPVDQPKLPRVDPVRFLAGVLEATNLPPNEIGKSLTVDHYLLRDLGIKTVNSTHLGLSPAKMFLFASRSHNPKTQAPVLMGALTIPTQENPVVYVRIAPGIVTWTNLELPNEEIKAHLLRWEGLPENYYGGEFLKGVELWLDGDPQRETLVEQSTGQLGIYHRGKVTVARKDGVGAWPREKTVETVRKEEPRLLGTPSRGDTCIHLGSLTVPVPTAEDSFTFISRSLHFAAILARQVETDRQ